MLGYLGLHVNDCGNGKFAYVGNIPTVLGKEVPASRSDIMGQRWHLSDDGSPIVWKFPVFNSKREAIKYASDRGIKAT